MKKSHTPRSNPTPTPSNAMDPLLINDKVYVKDISFENPGILHLLTHPDQKPDIQINLQVGVNSLDKNAYEVTLSIEAKATLDKQHIFLLELTYAGIFTVTKALVEAELKPLLLIDGPALLFPFARALISHLTQEGGLPPLLLNGVNFQALYENQHFNETTVSGKKK